MKRRAPAMLAAAAALVLAGAAEAQYQFFPYYGKNRVRYDRFAWKSCATDHFTIYFTTDDPKLLQSVVDMAETAYRRVSRDLKHDLAEPVPLLYYTTFTDFEQSNVFQVQEGILGVSEPILYRIGVHGDMAPDELQALIAHELAHIFQFDLLWGRQGGALTALTQPPLWTFEGLSEYVTREWSLWSTLILRDAVLNDRIPEFTASGEIASRYPLPRDPAYDFGHAIYEFIIERFGRNAIRDLWLGLKSGSSLLGARDPFERTFKMKSREFQQEFRRYLRDRFKDFLTRENPEDYSFALGPEFPMNPYYFAFSHAVSPSGELIATITYNALDGDMDIVLISAKDGQVLKNITKGYTSKYEYIKYEIDPSLGRSLAWSPDGDSLAFFARRGRRHALFLISVLSGKTLREIPLAVDQPAGPCFEAEGRRVIFGAFRQGRRDLFAVNLADGALTNLTGDDLYEKAPAVSPDGASIVYSVRVGSTDKLFLSPLADLKTKKQLTFGPGQTVCPSFSSDGRQVFFSGDAREAYNVYSLDLETGEMFRYTDVRTGNFYPAALPVREGGPRRVVFSSFNKGAFQIFRMDVQGTAEPSAPFVDLPAGADIETFVPEMSIAVPPEKIKPHEGMGKLYVTARPPADVILSTDGSFYGGSAIAFSDILGDHTFQVTAYQVRDFQSFEFGYLNRLRRFHWMARVFKFAIYYYPYAYYYDPTLWNFASTADAIAVREIKGAALAAYYPFSLYYRAEASLGIFNYSEDSAMGAGAMLGGPGGYFINGNIVSSTFALTGETTLFKAPYGPAAGHTFQVSVSPTLPLAESFIRNTTFQADLRKYLYLGSDFLLAFRWQGFASLGRDPFISYFGGNNTVRSADYYGIIGTKNWFLNAELRFPLVGSVPTIIGTVGPFRGALFFDVARNKLGAYPAKFYRSDFESGRLLELDAVGSFGYGLQAFLFGLPFHFEWVKRLEWRNLAKPLGLKAVSLDPFAGSGGLFSNMTLRFWIGYDF
ncbi:MAG: hypothetical protein FJY82_01220 [Candidatus Aminicenantes bacterium]|nr:hypothetical protein [Candidatus Aminicenantes bacterium]